MDANPLNNPASALVVGAGPVGALTALSLAQQGWQVTLLEKEPLASTVLPSSYDKRQLALTPQSVEWLTQDLGLTELLPQLTPITHIHTSSQGHYGSMLMTAQQQGVAALGYTISQHRLGEIIFAALAQTQVQLVSGVELSRLTQTNTHVELRGQLTQQKENVQWHADWLFAADGAQSWVRNALGIAHKTTHYTHQLMTAIATLAQPHQQGAIERFTASGPTAMLPLHDPYQVKLVYCYATEEADSVRQFNHEQLVERVNAQLGHSLPQVLSVDEVFHYGLVEVKPDRIQQGRVMLVGNAAHTQHPVAGQGLNLGIRDVQAVFSWARTASPAEWEILADKRLQDHRRIMRATHGLVSLFSHNQPLVRALASAGLSVLNRLTPLKKRITRLAMGY